MKVIVIILIIAVLVLCFLQMLTRIEVARLRDKEIAYDAQISVLQEKYADVQLNMEECLKDVHSISKHVDSNRKACVDVFATMDEHIHVLEKQICVSKKNKKPLDKSNKTSKENNKQ